MGSKANSKGCLYHVGLCVVVVVLVFWIIIGINSLSTSPFVLVTALMPLGSLILSLYKQRIGGLLIILSGFLPIIILTSIPSLKSDTFYGVGLIFLLVFVTLPLFVAGIIILAPSKEEPTKVDGELPEEPIDYKIINCPKCGSSSMIEKSIPQDKTKDGKQVLDYKHKWQRTCLNCKSKWIAVEK